MQDRRQRLRGIRDSGLRQADGRSHLSYEFRHAGETTRGIARCGRPEKIAVSKLRQRNLPEIPTPFEHAIAAFSGTENGECDFGALPLHCKGVLWGLGSPKPFEFLKRHLPILY